MSPAVFATGLEMRAVRARLWLRIALVAVRTLGPWAAVAALGRLAGAMAAHRSLRGAAKYVKAAGRYYWGPHCPGFPSPAFDSFIAAELRRTQGERILQTAIVAVTRRCPLACEHCFEWAALNRPEALSRADLGTILQRVRDHGAVQVLLSGGEPLARFDDLVAVLRASPPGVDFWLLTSGVGLDRARARVLKESGLTGVFLSLDHWSEEGHDRFRGRPGTREAVDRAAEACHGAGLAVNLSLVATRGFVTVENLERYGEAARALGAGFIQVFEPKAVGRYARRDVALGAEQVRRLEDFAARMNARADRAGVAYPDAVRRRIGCMGAGERYLYVDTEAQVHPCPFCPSGAGSALEDFDRALERVRCGGCPAAPDDQFQARHSSS